MIQHTTSFYNRWSCNNNNNYANISADVNRRFRWYVHKKEEWRLIKVHIRTA